MSDVSHRYSPPSSDVGNASEHQSPRLGMLRVVAAILMLYAGYIATFAVQSQSIVDALLAALLAVTAIGLWLRRRWSQYLVYAISAALVVFWLVQMQSLIASGWPYQDRVRSFVSAAILCVPLMFGVGIGVHVFRVFRRKR
jgi:hypothetical protein